MNAFVFVFAYVVSKNPKTPNLSPMADNAITQDGIGGLGSPLCIYGHDNNVIRDSQAVLGCSRDQSCVGVSV